MADIRPFHGIRFDPRVVGDIGRAICPPYDVISTELQNSLHEQSPYNLVRVEYGLSRDGDNSSENKYTRAGALFNKWLEQAVLCSDSPPAMYLHHHRFNHGDGVITRRAIFAAVLLEEWEKRIIRPHEGTAAVFKLDRLKLMRACQANISPVFSLYEDPGGSISGIASAVEQATPLFTTETPDGEGHSLWMIDSPGHIAGISSTLEKRPLYIADGHHRYETALTYRNERKPASPESGNDAAFNFVMMALVEFSDPGLVVFSFHRMVRGIGREAIENLRSKLEEFFTIESVSLALHHSAPVADLFLKPNGGEPAVIGLIGIEKDSLLLLRLRDLVGLSRLLPTDRSDAYRNLDVSILHHVILEEFLRTNEGENISYTRNELEARQRVSRGEYQLAFLLNAPDAYKVKAVADAGDKMPQKSTYFHPKLPSGLVLNRLEGIITRP